MPSLPVILYKKIWPGQGILGRQMIGACTLHNSLSTPLCRVLAPHASMTTELPIQISCYWILRSWLARQRELTALIASVMQKYCQFWFSISIKCQYFCSTMHALAAGNVLVTIYWYTVRYPSLVQLVKRMFMHPTALGQTRQPEPDQIYQQLEKKSTHSERRIYWIHYIHTPLVQFMSMPIPEVVKMTDSPSAWST